MLAKKVCSLALVPVLIALLAFAASAAPGDVLFTDDFSNGLQNWIFDTGTDGNPNNFSADAAQKALVFSPVGFGNAFAGSENLTDYALEGDVTITEYPQYGNLRFFVRMNELWYGYGVSFLEDHVYIHRFDGNWDVNTLLAEAETGIPLNTKTHVRVEVKGNQITVFVNGNQVAQAEDPDNVYPSGRFGFRFDYVSGQVANIKATAL